MVIQAEVFFVVVKMGTDDIHIVIVISIDIVIVIVISIDIVIVISIDIVIVISIDIVIVVKMGIHYTDGIDAHCYFQHNQALLAHGHSSRGVYIDIVVKMGTDDIDIVIVIANTIKHF